DRHTQRTAPSYPPVSFPSFIIYLNIYKSINTCINTFLFFFLLFFFTDFVCVCLLVQCAEATLTQCQCLRQTDRQTDRHTVRAAPGAVLAPGPEAMWKARSGFS